MWIQAFGREKKKKREEEVADIWDDFSQGTNDVTGSYTGRPVDAVRPEQDPDDL